MLKEYLTRIKYWKKISPSYSVLKEIHRLHLYNIPFENLDICKKRQIFLETGHLRKKILKENKGGYCYELNGLFFYLLKEIGFDVKMISARVSSGGDKWGPEFDHLAVLVNLDGLWLADVGFGDSFIEPLKFELDTIQKDKSGLFRISKYDNEYFKLSKSTGGNDFSDEYIFSLKERQWEEFQEMNYYHQTSPNSHFTKKMICSIATETGRISLSNDKLTITENGVKKIIDIKDGKEFNEKLFEYFGIEF